MNNCKELGCANPSGTRLKRGWCAKHYARWLKYGDPSIIKPIHTAESGRKRKATFAAKRLIRLTPRARLCGHCGNEFSVPQQSERRFCSLRCMGLANPHSKKLAANVYRDDRICEFCGVSYTIKFSREKKRRFCSLSCKAQWQAGLPYDQWRGKLSANVINRPTGERNYFWGRSPPHGKWQTYIRVDGTEIRLRSRYELIVAKYLDAVGLDWKYEPRRFHLDDRTYKPDFWLPSLGVFWEVKGWFHAKHVQTVQQFRQSNPDIPLVVVGHRMIYGIAKAVGMKPWAERKRRTAASELL